ncbi:hypothetical protein OESDEN_17103 [Oesophagostomum dentatum]|uniref:Uncharacterized protein n=1 Tax=Oesophagostomum dentatum TaxID=61180 RepID=A0A0B1SJ34_OESDE|nr:hypothetical protein OESDEN_17103 [Oesophagostomum dentatum]
MENIAMVVPRLVIYLLKVIQRSLPIYQRPTSGKFHSVWFLQWPSAFLSYLLCASLVLSGFKNWAFCNELSYSFFTQAVYVAEMFFFRR